MSSTKPDLVYSPVRPDRNLTKTDRGRCWGCGCAVACWPVVEESIEIDDDKPGDEEEVQPAVFKRDPMQPTAAEVEQHRITHLPFRSWCRECVEGRALGERRRCKGDDGERRIPVISFDYFYITSHGLVR